MNQLYSSEVKQVGNINVVEYLEKAQDKKVSYYRGKRDKVREGKKFMWNWSAMLFGSAWMIYRRIYINAFVTTLFSVILVIWGYMNDLHPYITLASISVLQGIIGNITYFWGIERKIERLQRWGATDDELINLIKPSYLVGLVGVLFTAGVLFLLALGAFLLGTA